MRTIETTPQCVAIRLSHEPVPARAELLRLVGQALKADGYAPWPGVEWDCFVAGEETLLLARPGAVPLAGVWAADRNTLHAMALACGGGPGALYEREGSYLLLMDESQIPPALYEFGQVILLPRLYTAHVREHFRTVFAENALSALVSASSTAEI